MQRITGPFRAPFPTHLLNRHALHALVEPMWMVDSRTKDSLVNTPLAFPKDERFSKHGHMDPLHCGKMSFATAEIMLQLFPIKKCWMKYTQKIHGMA